MPPTLPKFADAIVGRHLGRIAPPAERKRKVLPLKNFVKLATKPAPPKCDYYTKAAQTLSQMMGNDMQGDCVAVTVFKELGIDTAHVPGGTQVTASTPEVLKWYHDVGGPGDNGLYILDALEHARDRGFKSGGVVHKIDGFVLVDNGNDELMNVALYLFGGLHVGVALPLEWYQNADDADVWDVTNTRIIGGHSIPFTGYDATHFKLATWARQPRITRAAVRDGRWVDECYATLGKDWYNAEGLTTHGVNVDALKQALEAIRAGGTPDIPDDPNPPTPPTPPQPPAPPTPETITLKGTVDFFGNKLPVELAGAIAAAMVPATAPNWIAVVVDVAAIIAALRARDWPGLLLAVEKLLKDIGGSFTAEDRRALASALMTSAETMPLVETCEE